MLFITEKQVKKQQDLENRQVEDIYWLIKINGLWQDICIDQATDVQAIQHHGNVKLHKSRSTEGQVERKNARAGKSTLPS